MSFTYDITSTLGLVRFRIGDTINGVGPRPGSRNFSDEEIQTIIDQNSDIDDAVAALTSILATEWAVVPDTTTGDRKESFSQVSRALRDTVHSMEEGSDGAKSFSTHLKRVDGYCDE